MLRLTLGNINYLTFKNPIGFSEKEYGIDDFHPDFIILVNYADIT